MANTGDKTNAVKKEPFEITCAKCNANFRLWVPTDTVTEWESGAKISCIKCGARYVIKTGKNKFSLTEAHEPQTAT